MPSANRDADSPDFFLSPEGKEDPQAELEADIRRYDLSPEGHCPHCQAAIAGRFGKVLGRDGRAFGPNRIPVRLS